MAVLKHIAIKNADYSAAVCYLKYQHDERHLKPLLDENGSMMLRSEFHMNGVNCNPDTFDLECEMLNDQYSTYSRRKSHPRYGDWSPRADTRPCIGCRPPCETAEYVAALH